MTLKLLSTVLNTSDPRDGFLFEQSNIPCLLCLRHVNRQAGINACLSAGKSSEMRSEFVEGIGALNLGVLLNCSELQTANSLGVV